MDYDERAKRPLSTPWQIELDAVFRRSSAKEGPDAREIEDRRIRQAGNGLTAGDRARRPAGYNVLQFLPWIFPAWQ